MDIPGRIVRGTLRGLPPPRPVVTAMYCLPPMLNVTGKPCTEVPGEPCHKVFAGLDVNRAEHAVEVADERDAAGGREHGGQERRALLAPSTASFMVRTSICGELADVAVRAGHFEKRRSRRRRRRSLR